MAVAGERIGAYEVVRLIARGGMATVYEARQPALDRLVALKRLDLRTDNPTLVDRFIRESHIAASFDHPNIVTVFDFFEAAGVPYIAMEYLPRGSLRPCIGRLSEPQVFGVLEGILAALTHAEQHGVAHRDLKPENVLVTHGGAVKIGDFGIAKAYTRVTGSFTADGVAIGTPAYMAPEQALAGDVGAFTDLYALGVMAFELFSGAPPFDGGETPITVMYRHVNETPPLLADVDPRLAAWVARLLEKAPEARPAGAAEAWRELEEIVVDRYGPYWRRDAGLAVAGEAPAEPEPAGELGTTDEAPARETLDGTRLEPAPGASTTRVIPPGVRRRRGIAAAAAVVLGIGAVVAAVLLGDEDQPAPAPSGAAAPVPGSAAAPFDFDGDSRPTAVAGRPAARRGGVVALADPPRVLTASGPQRREQFGAAIASGDFDRNGRADLAIGAPGHDARDRSRREGAVTVLYGADPGIAGARRDTFAGPGSGLPYRSARFGAALAAGDLDGDGYVDLAVGAPGGDALPDEERGSGTIRLLFGGEDGLGDPRTLRRPGASLGRFGSVVAIGDVNRDGRADLIEGAPGVPAAAVPGHASFCLSLQDGPHNCRLLAELAGGPAALAIGDVTGDGTGDVVAGIPVNAYPDPAALAPAGAVALWPGTRRGPGDAAVTITQQTKSVKGNDQAGDEFGAAIAVADLDRDSFADIVVGTPGEDGSVGRVTIVRGGRDGLPAAAGPHYSQDTPGVPGRRIAGHRFGAALSLLDADGDGRRPDLLVTAPGTSPSLITLPGRPGGFTGSGASGRLAAGPASLGVG